MTHHILAISVGPVGGFIAAGRRSRDLWWGSTWISDCVWAIVDGILGHLKSPQDYPFLLPTQAAYQRDRNSNIGDSNSMYAGRVANKLILSVRSADQCKELAIEGRKAAHLWLGKLIQENIDSLRKKKLDQFLDMNQINRQIKAIEQGDFIEYRAGWASSEAWDEAMAEATQNRDASPRLFTTPATLSGLPKCDLDPGRDSVLLSPSDENMLNERNRFLGRVGVLPGEHLDALYLARRVSLRLRHQQLDSPGTLPFPPVGRIACEPYLEGLRKTTNSNLLVELQNKLSAQKGNEDFFLWCSPCRTPRQFQGANHEKDDLSFDPGCLYEGELDALIKAVERMKVSSEPLQALRPLVHKIHAAIGGTPLPYYALVELDGDGVGSLLEGIKSKDEYNEKIQLLYSFSNQADAVVRKHQGVPFYVAGDELLFYIPVDQALDAVKSLIALWDENVCTQWGKPSSLSGAILIVHHKDDLSRARGNVNDALKSLKEHKKKNHAVGAWLSIQEQPRAGDIRGVLGPQSVLHASLSLWIQDALSSTDAISLRTAHILAAHLARILGSKRQKLNKAQKEEWKKDASLALLLAQGAIFGQLQASSKSDTQSAPVQALEARLRSLNTTEIEKAIQEIEHLIAELLIAERIARIAKQRNLS